MDAAQRVSDERQPRNRGHDGDPEGTLQSRESVRAGAVRAVWGSPARSRPLVGRARDALHAPDADDRRPARPRRARPQAVDARGGRAVDRRVPVGRRRRRHRHQLAELAVAPSVAVSLGSPGVPVEPLGPPEPDPLALEEERRHRLEAEITFLREQVDLLTGRLAGQPSAIARPSEAEPPRGGRPAPRASSRRTSRRPAPSATTHASASTTSASGARRPRPTYDHARIERDAAQHELSPPARGARRARGRAARRARQRNRRRPRAAARTRPARGARAVRPDARGLDPAPAVRRLRRLRAAARRRRGEDLLATRRRCDRRAPART